MVRSECPESAAQPPLGRRVELKLFTLHLLQ
jgi:hypothetical protein